MGLYSEVVADAAVELLFPINALRNYALLLARTELVALGAPFQISRSFSSYFVLHVSMDDGNGSGFDFDEFSADTYEGRHAG